MNRLNWFWLAVFLWLLLMLVILLKTPIGAQALRGSNKAHRYLETCATKLGKP